MKDELQSKEQILEALRATEQKYVAIFNSTNEGFFLHELTEEGRPGKFVEANDRGCEMTGYSRDELLALTPVDIDETPPDVVRKMVQELLSKGRVIFETTMIAKNRNKLPIEISNHIFLLNGRRMVSSIVRDISKRRQAEKELKRSEAKYRSLVESTDDSIYLVDKNYNYVYMNRRHAARMGFSGDEYVGRAYGEMHSPQEAKVFTEVVAKVFDTGKSLQHEHSSRRDGSYYLRSLSPVIGDAEKIVAVTVISKNITERKKAEEKMATLAAIVESSNDAIIGKTLDGNIVSWNSGAERIYGYTAEEMRGRSIHFLIPPNRTDETPLILERVRRGERIDNYETMRMRKDGKVIDISLTISPIRDARGQITGASAIARDITKHKRMEEQIKNLSLTDELTGLYNRRGFFSLAEHLLKVSNRSRHGLYLLYADLDGLKEINDNFGHQEGDRALVEFAGILRESYRNSDVIARIGGDEFVVIQEGVIGDSVEAITARIQKGIAIHNTRIGRTYKLSLSVGIAYYDPLNPSSLDELLDRSDKLMYEQKKHKKKS
jgi:diguanylate cyclase (GGDEF)-like protein/PAS domain S-box-containing protein